MTKSPEQMTKTIEQALDYDQIMNNPKFGSGTSLQSVVDFMRSDISRFKKTEEDAFRARHDQTNSVPSEEEKSEFTAKLDKDARDRLDNWKKVLSAGANKAPVPELESKALGDAATKGFMDNLLTLNPQLMLLGAFDGIKSVIGSLIVKMEPVQKFVNTYTSYVYSHAANFFGSTEEPLNLEQAKERAEETAISLRLQEAVKGRVPPEQLAAFQSLAQTGDTDLKKLKETRAQINAQAAKTVLQTNTKPSVEMEKALFDFLNAKDGAVDDKVNLSSLAKNGKLTLQALGLDDENNKDKLDTFKAFAKANNIKFDDQAKEFSVATGQTFPVDIKQATVTR